MRLDLAGLQEFLLETATDEQLTFVAPSALVEAMSSSARIRIAAETDTRAMSRVDPRRQSLFEKARDPVRQAARKGRWVLTQYPTAAYATMARMTPTAYEEFVTRAMFLDRADARSAWTELGARQEGLVEFMSRIATIRIEYARHRPHAVGQRPYLDQLGRPPQHALRRDLHRSGRRFGVRQAAVRFSGVPRRPGARGYRAHA